jgi:hypothetical protein
LAPLIDGPEHNEIRDKAQKKAALAGGLIGDFGCGGRI